ncbi:MAG: efflux transporter outer membrane subunit [Pseudomonadota bacterium]
MSSRLPSTLFASVRLAPIALAALLSACATQPPHVPPATQPPAQYAADAGWQPAQGFAAMPAGAWWTVFDDPVLSDLEAQVANHNQTLAAQLAAYDQARAAIAQAEAAYAPTLSAGAAATRSKSATSAQIGNAFSANLGASWEPDLWGKVRLQVQAQQASAAASEATLRNTLLSLQSTLAQSYLQLRTVDAQIRLAQQTVADNARSLQLTENRYRAGVATAADVAAARTQWLQSQTALTDLGVTRAQLQNAIAVLVGQPPSNFLLPEADALPPVPAVPAGLPAHMLLRRPDLQAALAQVQAANAQIGVAQTAWFPNRTLSASVGSSAVRLADLFSAPTLFWSLGPQLAAALLDGGARQATVQASEASYRQTVANYRQNVLTALQGVENQLAAQRILAQEAQQQAQVVQAAEASLRLATNQYKAGTAPYLNVLTAQTTATAARNAELTLLNRRYAAAVGLIAALGGGWGEAHAAALVPVPAAAAAAAP